MKNLKIIALSLTLLFTTPQAMATGTNCQTLTTGPSQSFQAIAKSQSWLSKIFGSNFGSTVVSTFGSTFESVKNSVKSFVKNSPKTSFLVAGVGLAALVGVIAWLSSRHLKKSELKKQTGQNGQNGENSPAKEIDLKVKACNPKKTCIILYDDTKNTTIKAHMNSVKENLGLEQAFDFKGEFYENNIKDLNNTKEKYYLLIYMHFSPTNRLSINTKPFNELQKKAHKTILINSRHTKADFEKIGFFFENRETRIQNKQIPAAHLIFDTYTNKLETNEKECRSALNQLRNYINNNILGESLDSDAKEKEKDTEEKK